MRLGATLLLALVLLSTLTGLPVHSQALTLEAYFYAPAVSDSGKADLIKVTIQVSMPGSGRFEVDSGGIVDNTTYHSMKMAVMAASLYAGIQWDSVDFRITLDTNRNVAGPSGSLGVAIIAYIMLTRGVAGYQVPSDAAITGAISPDGAASRVGAVGAKCRAAMDSGVRFIYPLVNYTDALARECRGMPVPSMLNGSITLLGASEPLVYTNITLPPEFDNAMAEAANTLSTKARDLLSMIPENAREAVESRLNQSAQVIDVSPYAAASLAFTALYTAYRAYYSALLVNSTNIYEASKQQASLIEEELNTVSTRLHSMDYNGSILYLEFLSTAYTRLADAKTSLEEAKGLIDARAPLIENILTDIALAKARIDTINAWIDTAERVRHVGPQISIAELRTSVSLYGNYTKEAVLYANSILEYFIENYNVPRDILEVRINIINNLMREASTYFGQGNYVAALGFYREALSRTLSQIFGFFLTRSDPGVIKGYYNDLSSTTSLLQAQLASRGLISGLALAYREYAEVLLPNDPATAIGLLEEAISSSLAWYMLLLTKPPSGSAPAAESPSPLLRDPILTITVGVASYLLALLIVGSYLTGIARRAIH